VLGVTCEESGSRIPQISGYHDIRDLDVGETKMDSRNWNNSAFTRLSVSPRAVGRENEIGSEQP